MSYVYQKPTKITAQIVERNIQQQRTIDVQIRQYAAFSEDNNKLLYTANAQAQVEARRRQTNAESIQSEMAYEQRVEDELYRKTVKELEMDQNVALSRAMDYEATEKERHAIEIQRICEEAPELKELERALKIAYMNKDRAAQNQEKINSHLAEQQRLQAMEVSNTSNILLYYIT